MELILNPFQTKKCNEARTKTQTASAVITDATGAATTKPNVSFRKMLDRRTSGINFELISDYGR